MSDATISAGTYSSGTFTLNNSAVTNEHYITDQSLSLAVTSFDVGNMIRIDLSSSKAVDFLLHHNKNTSGDAEPFRFYYSTAGTSGLTEVFISNIRYYYAIWNIE